MELEVEGDGVTLRLTREEAIRLGVAVAAGYESVSRAEYYIRTGLSEPGMNRVAQTLMSLPEQSQHRQSIPVEAGVEEVENPRPPRPPREQGRP
jgi:hypothetical protein